MKKGDNWLADRVYSGVPAGKFGLEQKIRIGHMSGRSNIIYWLEKNNYDINDDLVKYMFEMAKNQTKMMSDEDLHTAVEKFKL